MFLGLGFSQKVANGLLFAKTTNGLLGVTQYEGVGKMAARNGRKLAEKNRFFRGQNFGSKMTKQ